MEELINLGISNEIPLPTFTVEEYDKYVKYGDDNQLGIQLLDLYTNVPLHRSILNKKSQLFNGEGVTFDADENDKKSKETLKFLNNVNDYENMDSLLNKIGLDWFIFGQSCLAVTWNRKGTKIVKLQHLANEKVRPQPANIYGVIEKYFYNPSDDRTMQWDEYQEIESHIKEFPAFSTAKNKRKVQILVLRKYEPTTKYFGLPDYFGARTALDTLKRIEIFHNDSITNGMQPGFLIKYKGDPSKEERNAIVKSVKEKFSNDNHGVAKNMFTFVTGEGDDFSIEPIGTLEIDKLYKELNKDTREEVTTAHQYPRALALSTPGSLGGSKEALDQLEIFINSYITNAQKDVLEYINGIMLINGLKEIRITNKPSSILKYTLSELQTVLTEDEIRAHLGYNPKEVKEVEEEIIDDENETPVDETPVDEVAEDTTDVEEIKENK